MNIISIDTVYWTCFGLISSKAHEFRWEVLAGMSSGKSALDSSLHKHEHRLPQTDKDGCEAAVSDCSSVLTAPHIIWPTVSIKHTVFINRLLINLCLLLVEVGATSLIPKLSDLVTQMSVLNGSGFVCCFFRHQRQQS